MMKMVLHLACDIYHLTELIQAKAKSTVPKFPSVANICNFINIIYTDNAIPKNSTKKTKICSRSTTAFEQCFFELRLIRSPFHCKFNITKKFRSNTGQYLLV